MTITHDSFTTKRRKTSK